MLHDVIILQDHREQKWYKYDTAMHQWKVYKNWAIFSTRQTLETHGMRFIFKKTSSYKDHLKYAFTKVSFNFNVSTLYFKETISNCAFSITKQIFSIKLTYALIYLKFRLIVLFPHAYSNNVLIILEARLLLFKIFFHILMKLKKRNSVVIIQLHWPFLEALMYQIVLDISHFDSWEKAGSFSAFGLTSSN